MEIRYKSPCLDVEPDKLQTGTIALVSIVRRLPVPDSEPAATIAVSNHPVEGHPNFASRAQSPGWRKARSSHAKGQSEVRLRYIYSVASSWDAVPGRNMFGPCRCPGYRSGLNSSTGWRPAQGETPSRRVRLQHDGGLAFFGKLRKGEAQVRRRRRRQLQALASCASRDKHPPPM